MNNAIRHEAAKLLASGTTVTSAAHVLGVSRRTLHRQLANGHLPQVNPLFDIDPALDQKRAEEMPKMGAKTGSAAPESGENRK